MRMWILPCGLLMKNDDHDNFSINKIEIKITTNHYYHKYPEQPATNIYEPNDGI